MRHACSRSPFRSGVLVGLLGAFAWPMFAMDDTLPARETVFKLSFAQVDAEQFFDCERATLDLSSKEGFGDKAKQQLTTLGFEYGWFPNVTAVFETQYVQLDLEGQNPRSRSDWTQTYMGIRQRLNPRNTSHAVLSEVGVWVPSDGEPAGELSLSSGSVAWQALMGYSQDFHPLNGGFEMDFGYRMVNEEVDDEYLVNTALFFGLGRHLAVRADYHVVESKENSLTPFDVLEYPPDHGEQTARVSAVVLLSQKLALDLAFVDCFRGRNHYAFEGFNAVLRWSP